MNNGQDDQDASEDKGVMNKFPGDGSIIIFTNSLIERNCSSSILNVQRQRKKEKSQLYLSHKIHVDKKYSTVLFVRI